jgi:hypothetical protein
VREPILEFYRMNKLVSGSESTVWVWPASEAELMVDTKEPLKVWRKSAGTSEQAMALCDALVKERERAAAAAAAAADAQRDAQVSEPAVEESVLPKTTLGPDEF